VKAHWSGDRIVRRGRRLIRQLSTDMEKYFRRATNSLEGIFAFLQEFATAEGLDESVTYVMNLVVEELFTNMVKYSPNGSAEIPISLTLDADRLIMRLVDRDVAEFDITKAKKANTELPLEERKPGGLGLHLIKHMVDEIEYQYRDSSSVITITKKLES
jgi:anti-sigma regulatory factor (Ser/Thr protein kinase)